MIKTPNKIPSSFNRISLEKKIPPEKDWLFEVKYEDSRKKLVRFHYEPRRIIRCGEDKWKKDLAVFRPSGSSAGCSFFIENFVNNKQVSLHWFLWNKGNNTYHIYDHESVLTNEEVMVMAESTGLETVIIKDLIN